MPQPKPCINLAERRLENDGVKIRIIQARRPKDKAIKDEFLRPIELDILEKNKRATIHPTK